MAFNVIHLLRALWNAIFRALVQQLTMCQLTHVIDGKPYRASRNPSAIAALRVYVVNSDQVVTIFNQAQNEYKHVLANILRSRYVARTPPVEARSPGRRSNVENALRRRPVTGQPATPTCDIRRAILRTPTVTHQSAASSARRPRPAGRSHYVVISRDGRKLVTTVRVMLPKQRNPCCDCKSAQ